MTIYAAIELTNPRLLLVTNEPDEAYKKVEEAKRLDGGGARYMVLQSDSLRLSPSAAACIPVESGIAGIEELVRTRMKEQNIDETSFPGDFMQMVFEIASDAYFNMMEYDICENDAVNRALKWKGYMV